MSQVFISYSRKDLPFAESLAQDLKRAGLVVWYDLSGLEGGERWGEKIQKAIKESEYVIVVLSPDSVQSEWVEREFLFSSKEKKKIIPLLYRQCEIPFNYLNLNYIDVQGEKYEQNYSKILKAVRSGPFIAETSRTNIARSASGAASSRPAKSNTIKYIVGCAIAGVMGLMAVAILGFWLIPKLIPASIVNVATLTPITHIPTPPRQATLVPSPSNTVEVVFIPSPSITAPPTTYYTYEIDYGSPIEINGGGGGGGNEMFFSCPTGYVATGLIGSSGTFLDSIGLQCGWLKQNGSIGDISLTEVRGGSGGVEFAIVCPESQFLTGIKGRSGDMVDQLSGFCQNVDYSQSFETEPSGGSEGNAFDAKCPSGYVVTGIHGRSGVWVDQVNFVCNMINKVRH